MLTASTKIDTPTYNQPGARPWLFQPSIGERPPLSPIGQRSTSPICQLIPVGLIRHLTEQCVDSGVGTLDDLYESIWGMGFQEYTTTFVNSAES